MQPQQLLITPPQISFNPTPQIVMPQVFMQPQVIMQPQQQPVRADTLFQNQALFFPNSLWSQNGIFNLVVQVIFPETSRRADARPIISLSPYNWDSRLLDRSHTSSIINILILETPIAFSIHSPNIYPSNPSYPQQDNNAVIYQTPQPFVQNPNAIPVWASNTNGRGVMPARLM